MVLRRTTNLRTHSKIILFNEVLPIAFSVIEVKLLSVTKLKTSFVPFVLTVGEPHQHHQNPAEQQYQTIKNSTNCILDHNGAPAHVWLLCLQYVCYLLNHTCNSTIYNVPLTRLTGTTVDRSPLLRFHFWEPVYYFKSETSFPSESKEGLGNIVGISEHCGHALT
jgi:hypothetical protein